MSWPGRLLLFLLIQVLNSGIFFVGWSYLQVDFTEKYLIGKEALFNGWLFPVSLIIHAISAPIALLIISLLVLFRFEKKTPVAHRMLGKLALLLGFFLVVPSGIGLSYFAMGGKAGKFIFFFLSGYTAFVILKGYAAARSKAFTEHRYWMLELMLLLCSAILLRIFMGLSYACNWTGDIMYITCALMSWVPGIVWMKLRYRDRLLK